MGSWWRRHLGMRPAWMNVLMFFCAFMALVYVPWDLFVKPVAQDEEVWFGIMLRGWAAKLTEPLHWAIYAAGAYGFWRMRPWMWPWASLYFAQLAFAGFIWSVVYRGGMGGWLFGLVSFATMGIVAYALWQARPVFDRRREKARDRYGEWALITGASSGIGAAFARALAREGMSCVLAARRQDRLQELASELEEKSRVKTLVVPVDLAAPDGPDRLARAVANLEIALLVNNAGYGYAGAFVHQGEDRLQSMIALNCSAPVLLTRRLLPAMRERGRGAVIVTGSIAGAQPVPYNGVYSATKAFDRYFGEMLWAEMQGSGVDVLVLEPGPTETEFQAVAGETPHPGEPSEKVVEVALEALGRQPSVVSGWFNWIRSVGVRFLPRSLATLIAARVMKQWVPVESR